MIPAQPSLTQQNPYSVILHPRLARKTTIRLNTFLKLKKKINPMINEKFVIDIDATCDFEIKKAYRIFLKNI